MCPLGCGEQDNIPNILLCRVLNQYQKSESVTDGEINYNNIFSNNIEKQKQVTELYEDLLEIRTRLINSQPLQWLVLVPCRICIFCKTILLFSVVYGNKINCQAQPQLQLNFG